MHSVRHRQIAQSLKRKRAYRNAFVESQIKIGLPLQIRALRQAKGWSQKKLGQMAGGIAQEVISRLESPGYGRVTLSTALRLASAFDVGLTLRFVPFSEVLDQAVRAVPNEMTVPSSKHDTRLDDAAKGVAAPAVLEVYVLVFAANSENGPDRTVIDRADAPAVTPLDADSSGDIFALRSDDDQATATQTGGGSHG